MARQPVQINSVTSASGQVGNRAAYMRPGRDNSGSKALASALSSLSGSLGEANRQVDRYQSAQRQAELEEAQRFQNQEVARLSAEGIRDAEKGVSARGSYMIDSPIYQAAYQENHLETTMAKSLREFEIKTDFDAYNKDVDDGHNRLQQDLLEVGEGIMAGYSPELQAKFYPRFREYANKKMIAQADAARIQRRQNIATDGTENLRAMFDLGASTGEITATVEELGNLLAAGGVDKPSEAAVAALMIAGEQAGADTLEALTKDKDFMKSLSATARNNLLGQIDKMRGKERGEAAYMRQQEQRAMNEQKGTAILALVSGASNAPGDVPQMVNQFEDAMMSMAAADPARASSYLDTASRMRNALMPSEDLEMDPVARTVALTENLEFARYLGSVGLDSPEAQEALAGVYEATDKRDHRAIQSAIVQAASAELPTEQHKLVQSRNRVIGDVLETSLADMTEFTQFSRNADGSSNWDVIFNNKWGELVATGMDPNEAQEQSFYYAAEAVGLYQGMTSGASVGGGMVNPMSLVNAFKGSPDIKRMLFSNNNPAWTEFKANYAEQASMLATEADKITGFLPDLE